jgi:beta-galactosidase beta subunit
MIQIAYSTQNETLNKEINHIQEKIKFLEATQKEVKLEQDNMRLQYEHEIHKLTNELKYSEEKL